MKAALALLFLLLTACWCAAQDDADNLARGCSYTLSPPPNYGHCTDPGDLTQLTDGVYSEGYFWVQPSTVGWTGGGLKFIQIDLGRVHPIRGVSFNTAAGVAQVHWPQQILIFVSADGQAWYLVGDLMKLVDLKTLPEYGTYAVRKLETRALQAHGRYVLLAVTPEGAYTFVDEIEVYPGPREYLTVELPGPPIEDVQQHFRSRAFMGKIQRQLTTDLGAVREDLVGPELTAERRQAFTARAQELERAIADMPPVSPAGFRAVLPLNDLHRQVLALGAEVWRAQGKPDLRVWHCSRWDYLAPTDEPAPEAPPPAVTAHMMNGEVRADVLNLTNAAPDDMEVRISLEGLDGRPPLSCVTVREVLHVGTRHFRSVAAALPEARREGEAWLITVPCGMTVQVWFEFRPTNLTPGEHPGAVVLSPAGGESLRVPLSVQISPLTFPPQQSLLVGGWDYVDGGGTYGVKPTNREALVAYLRDHRVNMPWATSSATPAGTYDPQGNMTAAPDTARFDEWVRIWAGARLYMVFLAQGDSFAGHKMGTTQFKTAVGNWAHFWAQHMRELGLAPGQLGFLVLDEPNDETGFAINEQWARAIEAAEPELVTFVDPIASSAAGMDSMCEAMDVLCPNRTMWLNMEWMADYYGGWRDRGKQLWFYSCDGPARSFDPYSYYLLQAWHAFAVGGNASCFWAFGDDNGADVWNEYVGDGPGPYCPMYLEPTGVTTAKWFEAIRESAQDYEYLVMLRERVTELEKAGLRSDQVTAAKALLQSGPARVLAGEHGANYRWDQTKDRSVVDEVRRQLLEAIERLSR